MSLNKNPPDLSRCPCCGTPAFTSQGKYEICPVCGWEDDPVQSADPNYAGGANEMSLNQARQEWISTRRP